MSSIFLRLLAAIDLAGDNPKITSTDQFSVKGLPPWMIARFSKGLCPYVEILVTVLSIPHRKADHAKVLQHLYTICLLLRCDVAVRAQNTLWHRTTKSICPSRASTEYWPSGRTLPETSILKQSKKQEKQENARNPWVPGKIRPKACRKEILKNHQVSWHSLLKHNWGHVNRTWGNSEGLHFEPIQAFPSITCHSLFNLSNR